MPNESINIDVKLNTEEFQKQLDELNRILQQGMQKISEESKLSSKSIFDTIVSQAGNLNVLDTALGTLDGVRKAFGDQASNLVGDMTSITQTTSVNMANMLASVASATTASASEMSNLGTAFMGMGTQSVDLTTQIDTFSKKSTGGFASIVSALGPVAPALGLATVAFGGLAVAAVLAAEKYGIFMSGSGELRGEIQALADKHRELTDSFVQSEEALGNRIGSLETNAELARRLGEEVAKLSEKENRTVGETELLKQKIGELNGVVPDLGLVFDDNTQKMNINSDALLKQIDNRMELLRVQMLSERQTELMREQLAAEEALTEAEAKRAEAQATLKKWQEEVHESTIRNDAELYNLQNAVKEAEAVEKSYNETIAEKKGKIEELNKEIINSAETNKQANADKSQSEQDAAKATEKSSEKQIAAYDNTAVEAQRAADATGKSVQEMTALANSNEASAVGANIAEGVGVGMQSKEGWLATLAKGLINSIFLAMKGTALISSPSKITTQFGAYMAEGLALGMAENEKLVNRAAENLISGLFDTMEDASERRLADEILTIDRIIEEEKRLAKETARLKDIASKEDAIRTAKTAEDKIEAEVKLAETLRKYEIEDLEARRKMLSEELEAFEEVRNERVKVLEDAVYREREINTQYFDEEANKAIELTNVKIQLYDDEYIAKVRAIDAELAAFLEMNNRQIEEIISRIEMEDEESAKRLRDIQERKIKLQELSESEKAAREQKAKDEKEAELLNRIWEAETMEQQMKAGEEYNKWRENEDYKMREKARGEEIKRLDEQFKAEVENQKKINEAKLTEIEKLNEESKARIGLSVETIANGGIDLEKEKEAQAASLTQKETYFADDAKITEKHYEQTLENTQSHQSKVHEVTSEYYRQKQEALKSSQAAEYSLIDMFNRNVINLLYSFTPSWYQAGVLFMDGLITGLQSRLSDLNSLVSQIQSAMSSVSGGYSDYDVPFYGTGGVVTSPRLAVVGDVPEAIIPLNQLNSIITSATAIALPYYAARADDGGNAKRFGGSENVKKEVYQTVNISINQPVKSPAEMAREIKNISRELARGY